MSDRKRKDGTIAATQYAIAGVRSQLTAVYVVPSIPRSEAYHKAKRFMDIAGSIVLLVLLAPLFAMIAIAIKLTSAGPVIFVQWRVGAKRRKSPAGEVWELRKFSFYKFRSMAHNVDDTLHREYIRRFSEARCEATNNREFKLANDPRVTRVGRLLRSTSLDELPQLFNVLRGDMSLVGPRPVPDYEVERYRADHYERLAALPGITGAWQVNGRSRVTFEQMINMDIEYVRSTSFITDLKLLIATLPAVIASRGAS